MVASASTLSPPAGGRLGRLWAQARWDERVGGAMALLALADLVRLTRTGFGWDTQVYCAAAAAFGQGLDPYHVENLAGLSLSFVYQPIYLTLIAPLCGVAMPVPHPYTLASLVAVVLSVVLWPGALSRDGGVPAAVLALGGVSGLAWTVLTGNTSAFEVLVLTLAVVAMRSRRWAVAAVILGLLGSLKLVSLGLLAAVLVADAPWRQRGVWLGYGLAAFAAVAVVSAALHPDLMVSFFQQITGRIGGQHTPINETGDLSHPSLMFALAGLAGLRGAMVDGTVGYSPGAWAVFAGAFVVIGIAALAVVRRQERGECRLDIRIGFALLILILFMPRLKPYAFLLSTLPVWLLVRPLAPAGRAVVLAVAVALPALTGLTGGFPLGKTSVWWNFQQPLSLLLVLILLLLAHSPFGERLRLRGV